MQESDRHEDDSRSGQHPVDGDCRAGWPAAGPAPGDAGGGHEHRRVRGGHRRRLRLRRRALPGGHAASSIVTGLTDLVESALATLS